MLLHSRPSSHTHCCSCVLLRAEGRGVLKDAHTVEVTAPNGDVRVLRAKHILLATGGVPTKLHIPGAVSCQVLSARGLPCTGRCL